MASLTTIEEVVEVAAANEATAGEADLATAASEAVNAEEGALPARQSSPRSMLHPHPSTL